MKSTAAKKPKKQIQKIKQSKADKKNKTESPISKTNPLQKNSMFDNWLNKGATEKNAQSKKITTSNRKLRVRIEGLNLEESQNNKDSNFSNKVKARRNKSSITEYERIYQCNQCSFQTKQQYYYNSHVKIHSRPDKECPYCKKVIKSQSYKMHIKIHERNDKSDYKCKFCDYKSYNHANVKRHILTNHKNPHELETYSCDLCDYITVLPERLKQHKKGVHSKEGIWQKCTRCDYTTRRKAHMARHINDLHEEKKIRCEQCSQLFSSKENLRYHTQRRHTEVNEKIFYYCEMCPKEKQYKSTEKGNLARHILTHRTWDEIEVFACHKCSYLAKLKSALKIHFVNSHMPEMHTFKCGICGYSTSTKSRYNCHVREVHGKPKAKNKIKNFTNMEGEDSDVVMKQED